MTVQMLDTGYWMGLRGMHSAKGIGHGVKVLCEK